MNIQKLMTKKVVTCRPTDTLNDAAALMWEHDCGILPVIDEDESLVGVITDRDICMASYTQGCPLHSISVAETMSTQLFSCHESEPVELAEQLMSEKQLRRIPVVDSDNGLVGMIALSDIARYAALSQEKKGLLEISKTLSAICQPRAHSLEGVRHIGA